MFVMFLMMLSMQIFYSAYAMIIVALVVLPAHVTMHLVEHHKSKNKSRAESLQVSQKGTRRKGADKYKGTRAATGKEDRGVILLYHVIATFETYNIFMGHLMSEFSIEVCVVKM